MKQNLVSKTVISHVSALVIIWVILPFFQFSSYDLFASEIVKIFLSLLYFIVFYLIKAHKDYKISFYNADQEHGGYLSKFAESIKELVYSQTKDSKFFSGRGLYKSPWFLTLGLPNSGKTTIVKNSNLHFDFKHSQTSANVNKPTLDWYSSKDATFIDMNAKLASADRVEENTLFDDVLEIIKRARRLKPLDGLIISVNAEHLITDNIQELERDFNKYKVLLKKIYNSGIRDVPIYVFISNMDKISGFTQYFDSKTFDVTNSILGVTLPSSGVHEPIEWLDEQLNEIVNNINANIFSSIRKKNSNIDSHQAFYFARYFSYLNEKINTFLSDVIYENSYTKDIYLRGVYFTSVCLNKIHHFDKSTSDVYFLKNIMKDVVVREASKTTIFDNIIHFLSKHKNYVYTVTGVGAVGLVFSWITGYTQASYYLAQVKHTNNTLQPIIGAPLYSSSYWQRIQKLEYLAKLRDKEFGSWHHFGFGFPVTTDQNLDKIYELELQSVFKPYVLNEIKNNMLSLIDRINSLGSDETVDKAQKMKQLYNWLMVYVMFNKTQHLDAEFIQDTVDSYWENIYKADDDRLSAYETYLNDLLLLPTDKLHSELDNSIIEKARAVLGGDIYIYRAYEQFKQKNMEQKANYRPTILGSLKYVNLFDKPVSINYIYTIDGWENYSKEALVKELELAEKDQWAFASASNQTDADIGKAKQKIFNLYWSDYANIWSQALKDIKFKHIAFEEKYNASKTNDSYLKVFNEIFSQLKTNLTTDVVSSTADTDRKMVASITGFVNNDYRVNQLNDKIKQLEKLVTIMSNNTQTSQQQAFVVSKLIATNKQGSFVGLTDMVKDLPSAMTSLVNSYLSSFTYSMFNAGASYDIALWNKDLSESCASKFASNYPFSNSKDEIGLDVYKETMSKTSTLMDYMNNNIYPFMNREKTGELAFKEIYGVKFPLDKGLFKQVNILSQLDALTKNNNSEASDKLNMVVGLTPVLLSSDLSGVDIIYNGKKYGYYNGPQYQQDLYWPASKSQSLGTVQVIWHYKNHDDDTKYVYTGPWGLIKLLSQFEYNSEDKSYTIRFGETSFAKYKITTKGKGSINSLGSLENLQCKF